MTKKEGKDLEIDEKLFEKIFILNCLIDETFLPVVVNYTKPSYFKDKDIGCVFNDISAFFREYGKVPNFTELKSTITDPERRSSLKNVLQSFQNLDKSYSKDFLYKTSEKFLREKAVMSTLQTTSLDVQSGEIDPATILKRFEEACGINLTQNIGFDYFENIDELCENLKMGFETISTGWDWLDRNIGGGWMKDGKALYVFFGVANVGKSIFLGNIASNLLSQGKRVLLISMEMSELVYSQRISSNLTRIKLSELADKTDVLSDRLNKYKASKHTAKLLIKEFPTNTINPLQLTSYIHRLGQMGYVFDAIIIDYLNLLNSITPRLDSYEKIKEIASHLRAMSYTFKCPIITATQGNRDAYGVVNPDLDTTSESIALPQIADAQFSIWTEEQDLDLGLIHLGISKNRFGKKKITTVFNLDYETLTLTEGDDIAREISEEDGKKPIPEMGIKKKTTIDITTKNTIDLIQKLADSSDDDDD